MLGTAADHDARLGVHLDADFLPPAHQQVVEASAALVVGGLASSHGGTARG